MVPKVKTDLDTKRSFFEETSRPCSDHRFRDGNDAGRPFCRWTHNHVTTTTGSTTYNSAAAPKTSLVGTVFTENHTTQATKRDDT